MARVTPAYLITLQEQGSYLGGLMATDSHGIPLDFRYTVPVVPTKVQRIIYGSVLEQYIRNHVVIGALLQEISEKPSFYVVPQHQLLDIEDANPSLSLLSIQRTQLTTMQKGSLNRPRENECLLQGWIDTHPIRILFGNMPIQNQEGILKDLIELSRHMDLFEPLERLEMALKTLCTDKTQD